MFESVEKFRNVHKGKIGYVLGAGTSLSKYNMEKVSESGIIFSCNYQCLKNVYMKKIFLVIIIKSLE